MMRGKREETDAGGGLCDTCEFNGYDELTDTYGCEMRLDEDEYARYLAAHGTRCPYYRYYDEYTSVRKQN